MITKAKTAPGGAYIPFAFGPGQLTDFDAMISGEHAAPFLAPALAGALANINRYAGRGAPLSVAAHSILVSRIAGEICTYDPEDAAALALLHDAHESILGDQTAPGRLWISANGGALALQWLDRLAAVLDAAILDLYQVRPERPDAARASARADRLACMIELDVIFGFHTGESVNAGEIATIADGRRWLAARMQTAPHADDRAARDRDDYLRELARLDGLALTIPE